MKDPAQYAAVGARAPRGVLLDGPPGTGKTGIVEVNIQNILIFKVAAF